MTTDASAQQWILLLSLTALLLSVAVISQVLSRSASAYLAAPREVAAFLDAVDSTIAENESYDLDITKIQRLEDKLRLSRLLRDIQKGGDALREDVNLLMVGEDDSRLRTGARLLWASKRAELQEKVRQLDLLRMRFLVVQMGIVAGIATEAATAKKKKKHAATAAAAAAAAFSTPISDLEKSDMAFSEPRPGFLPRSLTDSIKARPPLRRLTTQAIGHQNSVEVPHRMGWAGVVQELQKSPLLHKRHASIEMSMAQAS
ncbi:hypothetical protein QBC37DRAFT_144921 [Rhypophila decipiens]|uniref:Uncharacterized protein n=1 Tax=Rhypophila decipiens TaxID=261697 RepID=A0AAN6YB98_9PEZI|nr:hypothetical protein QBC37DRAFT_144921 [Rhypophila decipiens]